MSTGPRDQTEFDLIARIRARAGTTRDDVILGIGDDAAVLQVPAGKQLVVTMDALNAGVHFPLDTAPSDIGWKALAVNLSDLAAMGAQPAWCTLALSLPASNTPWIDAFLDGFLALARRHDVALIGGDTTRGPLSICVTAHGFVDPGKALRRDGAQVGDDIWVAGTLGEAAAALALLDAPASAAREQGLNALRGCLDRPVPRIEAGRAIVDIAQACIDVSDGLFADLDHVCQASRVGAEFNVDALPASTAFQAMFDLTARRAWQAGGGDDYALCFTAQPQTRDAVLNAAAIADTPMTRIGRVVEGREVRALDADGQAWQPPRRGYQHFS